MDRYNSISNVTRTFEALDTTLWIVLGIGAAVMVIYFVTMRVFFRQSRDADKKIDYSKVREWKDEEG
jgi:signal transduction histidine kinase